MKKGWDHRFRLYTAIEDLEAHIEGTRNSTSQLLCFVDAAANTATALSRDVHFNRLTVNRPIRILTN